MAQLPTLGKYLFHYPGKQITQTKTLIPHSLWLEAKAIKDDDEHKAFLKPLGEWFTDQSPLYQAIFTGKLEANNVSYVCIVTKL